MVVQRLVFGLEAVARQLVLALVVHWLSVQQLQSVALALVVHWLAVQQLQSVALALVVHWLSVQQLQSVVVVHVRLVKVSTKKRRSLLFLLFQATTACAMLPSLSYIPQLFNMLP